MTRLTDAALEFRADIETTRTIAQEVRLGLSPEASIGHRDAEHRRRLRAGERGQGR